MKQEVKAELIEALRSGEYPQGKGGLKYADGRHCVHGVLCEVYAKHHPAASWVPHLWSNGFLSDYLAFSSPEADTTGDDTTSPPRAVREWAEMDYDEMNALMKANDKGRSFLQIADLLEAQS